MNADKFLVINKYQIDYNRMLGKGAMAKVYFGYYREGQGNKNQYFAVKEIPINASAIATEALLQEINLLRKLNHPFILKYVDAKKTPNSLFLFLQYCNKGTLEDFILENKEDLSEEILKRFIAQMSIALKFLKVQSIIHRDIKPKNILIQQDGIKISDFGVAKMINKHNSDRQTITFSGTIQYMSPQILKQEKYTYQTDVWSLGITIYFMIFQKLPWIAQKVLGIVKEIERDGVIIPETNGFSPLLLDLLQKMLLYEESDRITIEQICQHEYLRDDIKKLQIEIEALDKKVESKQITKQQFMMNSLSISSEISEKELERRSNQVKQGVRASLVYIDAAREGYRKLSNYKEHIFFFKEHLQNLRAYHMKKELIPEGLFRKCEFLLVKRCYIIAKDLQQILLFSTHTQGNIIIPKHQFTELLEGKTIYQKTLRSEVGRLYEEFKNEWLTIKQSFDTYRRIQGLKIKPRQDAYFEHLVQSTGLIEAFNDCFLQLFYHFAQGIVHKYSKRLSEEILSSTILLEFGVKIQFVYDIMIVLCFPNVVDQGSIKNYRDKKKKKVLCPEYIYRISIAYKEWLHRYEPLK